MICSRNAASARCFQTTSEEKEAFLKLGVQAQDSYDICAGCLGVMSNKAQANAVLQGTLIHAVRQQGLPVGLAAPIASKCMSQIRALTEKN